MNRGQGLVQAGLAQRELNRAAAEVGGALEGRSSRANEQPLRTDSGALSGRAASAIQADAPGALPGPPGLAR
jgi:hypothetical protein